MLRVSSWIFRALRATSCSETTRACSKAVRAFAYRPEADKCSLPGKPSGKGQSSCVSQCLAAKLLHHLKRFGKLPLQRQNPKPGQCHQDHPDRYSGGIEAIAFSATLRSPFHGAAMNAFNAVALKRLRRRRNRAINSLVGGLEIALGHVTQAKVNQDVCVFRIERGGFFQIGVLIPPTCPDVAEWRRWPCRLGLRSAGRAWRSQTRRGRARNRDRHNNKRNRERDGLREDLVAIARLHQH